MQKDKQNFVEICVLLFLFIILAGLSYYHVTASISVVKYHFQWGIKNLLDNYSLFHQSFSKFLFQTSTFHPGSTESGWRTVFYLLPLFIFCDLLGGLSLKAVCLFTVTTSLILVGLFYWWMRGVWGRQAAFFAAFLFGFSSVFQELARSGSFGAYSLLIAMIWILVLYHYREKRTPSAFLLLGLFTGLTWYGYGMLRCFTLVAMAHILGSRNTRKSMSFGLFLIGMLVVLVPGFIIKAALNQHIWVNSHNHSYMLFFDRECIFFAYRFNMHDIAGLIFDNLKIFGQRMSGGVQLIEPAIRDNVHACFWNHWLVIPLLIGIGTAFRLRREASYGLLLFIGFFVYLIPCFLMFPTGEARRYLLYLIPSYCFIGLGIREILGWIKSINNNVIKRLISIILVGIIFIILISEKEFIAHHILTPKRDLGLLVFSQEIKQKGVSGDLYYLEKGSTLRSVYDIDAMRLIPFGKESVYQFAYESDVLRAALMENGRSPFNVKSVEPNSGSLDLSRDSYVVKSPLISQQEFDAWSVHNKLTSVLMFESPVVNLPSNNQTFRGALDLSDTGSFKFYAVHRLS